MEKKKTKKIETVLKQEAVRNPMDILLQQIRLGTSNEIKDAWLFAESITKGKDYPQLVLDNVQQIIAVSSLYLMYAHAVRPKWYPKLPTIQDLISFLSVSIVEEEVYDEDTDEMHIEVNAKNFVDTIHCLIDLPVTTDKGVTLEYLDVHKNLVKRKNFTKDDIKKLYPTYVSIIEVEPYLHPYIFSEFSRLVARDWKKVMEAVNTAVVILTKQRNCYD